MGISLVTFAGSTVTPQDDALVYETAISQSGLIYGGAVTIGSASVLHVAAGHGIICGRKFTIDATDISVTLPASDTLNGRLYIHMDLSDSDTPISLLVETASSVTPEVQDANVNITNGVYEIRLADFTVDPSTIDNLVDLAPMVSGTDSELSLTSSSAVSNKTITKTIGTPETIGELAVESYSVGDKLVTVDGKIYDVTAAITAGSSTLTEGTNVTEDVAILPQINQLNTELDDKAQSYTISFSGGTSINNHQTNLNSMWTDFPIGTSVVHITDGGIVWHGTMEKYSNTTGSILYTATDGTVRKYVKSTNTCSVIPDDTVTSFNLTSLMSNITLSYGRSARVGKVIYVKKIFTGTRANSQTTTAVGAGQEFISGFPKGDWMTDVMLIDGNGKPYGTVRINESGNAYANIAIPEGTYTIVGCYITTE